MGRLSLELATFVLLYVGTAVAQTTGSGANSDPNSNVIARGGGTTIIQGGTGAPSFTLVLTRIAFHVEKQGGVVTGAFECLALAPEAATGPTSAQFTVNAMYVTGQITGAAVNGDTASLTGTANITGLGAGTNVSHLRSAQRRAGGDIGSKGR